MVVEDRVLPSGSLNQATCVPSGVVQTPALSCSNVVDLPPEDGERLDVERVADGRDPDRDPAGIDDDREVVGVQDC
jgi:hypothetical protein